MLDGPLVLPAQQPLHGERAVRGTVARVERHSALEVGERRIGIAVQLMRTRALGQRHRGFAVRHDPER
jgi:hypothetical protein